MRNPAAYADVRSQRGYAQVCAVLRRKGNGPPRPPFEQNKYAQAYACIGPGVAPPDGKPNTPHANHTFTAVVAAVLGVQRLVFLIHWRSHLQR